jgi:hypothetical protein
MLRECKASAVHIEMRDDYTPDDPWFRAWREGDREEFERQLARSWLDEIRQVIARGVVVRRLRMVSEPVTDYIRFECDTTRSNVETGEHVRDSPVSSAGRRKNAGCGTGLSRTRTTGPLSTAS